MTNSVYKINKGINKSIEFRGLKAQYIWYLGGAMLGLLVLFAIMYIIGINTYICLVLILAAGTASFMYVYKLSNTYGEFGMMKKAARQGVPKVIQSKSRQMFRTMHKPGN
jgi:predicted lysophospholipase L1 biosynthesis ABC-type transport system permease subunit